MYLSLHCHHQNDSCIKMGSDESHFNVSLTVRDKVTRQRPQTTIFEVKGEPKRIRTEVHLLTSWAKPAHADYNHHRYVCTKGSALIWLYFCVCTCDGFLQ